MPLSRQVLSTQYLKTQKLLYAAIDYSIAAQICASGHEQSCQIKESDGEFSIEIAEDRLDKRYGSLEAMRQSAGEYVIAHSSLFWFWMTEVEHRPAVLMDIMNSTALKHRRIHYEYNPYYAYELAQHMPQAPFLIPEEWVFSWGTKYQTTLLINSLSLRVLYHLIAIQLGAQKYRLKGGAEYDLCLVQPKEKWIGDLEEFSQISIPSIEGFLDSLTYGNGTKSPDQALQPFVPLGSNLLGVGPLGWLSSNTERNLLSLQARLDSRAMDGQSHLFERRMTSQLLEVLKNKWSNSAANLTLTLDGRREEIDLLVCDVETKTILVGELRWMLPPADPREVQARKNVCWQKVVQVKRKSLAVASNLESAVLSAFGLNIQHDGWTVQGIVVIEGYGGAKSLDKSIPVVPEWVLMAGVEAATSLRRLCSWAMSLDWLPMEGREFDVLESTPHLEDLVYRYPSLSPLRAGREYLLDATEALRRRG